MRNSILLIIFFLAFIINYGIAKNEYQILAIVNNQAITSIDLQNEIKIYEILNNQKITNLAEREKILTNLINDEIKKQEVEKHKIETNQSFVKNYFNNYLKQLNQNNIKLNSFNKELVYEKIKLSMKWKILVKKNYQNKLNINTVEIDKIIEDKKSLNSEDSDKNLLKNKIINNEIEKKFESYEKFHFNIVKKKSLIKIFE